jgi:altronate hydrolase
LFAISEVSWPMKILRIHPSDNVAVALQALQAGQAVEEEITALSDIAAGHKIALRAIRSGEAVIKYGYPIGIATCDIRRGEDVHSHNLASAMAATQQRGDFHAADWITPRTTVNGATFDGFRRTDGSVGIRNEIWIINTVGCVNHTAARIAERAAKRLAAGESAVEGIYTFNHPYGCSQLGNDLLYTQKLLGGLARHPNAGAVLLLGLGCENNQMKSFIEELGGAATDRFRYFNAQEVDDEVETGVNLACELSEYASQFKREPIPARELVLGMKCGGSDGLSGITANPLVGRIADKLAAAGGTAILTEVPEMFGAEKALLDRVADTCAYEATIQMVNEFRNYFRKHNEPIDENPSPGNKAGGITTLAEKSLGCVQKGGSAPIRQVLAYGERVTPGTAGIALLNGPGNDGVSGSALCASGAQMILFTTGRGNPMGFPVPTIKIASNTPLAEHKKAWIDFSAGSIADGSATIEQLVEPLFDLILAVASGRKRTRNEINGYREIAIWKDGVTL